MEGRDCAYSDRCGFFRKFGGRRSRLWRALVDFYCQGTGAHLCEVQKALLSGRQVSDDLMPTGADVPEHFHRLD